MSNLTHPPIPKRLREVLKDYPEHLEQLQKELDDFAVQAEQGPQLFEKATWVIEGAMDSFAIAAFKEEEAAEASGDPIAIAKAAAKSKAMVVARSKLTWLGDEGFGSYFHVNRDAFK